MKRLPKRIHHRNPSFFAARNLIQLIFEIRGKRIIHVLREMFRQETVNNAPNIGWGKTPHFQFHVFTRQQRGNNAGIGRRAANTKLFQRFYQRCFRITWWRFGEMLIRFNIKQSNPFAFNQRRQRIVFLVFAVVQTFFVNTQKTGVTHRRTRGSEKAPGSRGQIRCYRIERRENHLARHSALPDQIVQLKLFLAQKRLHAFRGTQGGSRAHRFVGFLCVFGLGFVKVRGFRQFTTAVTLPNQLAQFRYGFVCQRYRVSTHIGNQTHRTATAQINPFVQLLGNPHRALG